MVIALDMVSGTDAGLSIVVILDCQFTEWLYSNKILKCQYTVIYDKSIFLSIHVSSIDLYIIIIKIEIPYLDKSFHLCIFKVMWPSFAV